MPLRLIPAAAPLIGLSAAVAVASFLEGDPTRNDFERFTDARLLILFLVLLAGLSLVYVRAALQPPLLNRRSVIVVALAALALLLVSFPVGSRDLFVYAFYGKMWWAYDTHPYLHSVADFAADPWQPYVQVPWRHWNMLYGPLFLWQCRLTGWLTGDHLFAAVWAYKATAALALVGLWWLAARIGERSSDQEIERSSRATITDRRLDPSISRSLGLFLLNPLLLFEAAGNGHNDIVMALLVVAAVWCWQQSRFHTAMGFLAVSFWYKWYGLLLVPVFLLAAGAARGVRAAGALAAGCAAVVLAVGGIVLYSIPGALPVIAAELMQPKQLSEIYPTELSPLLAPWFWMLRASGAFATPWGADLFHGGRVLLFIGAYVAILVRQWLQERAGVRASGFAGVPIRPLVEAAFLVSTAFTMLLITILWPWHLILPICLGILTGRPLLVALAVALTVIGLLSYFLTFAVAALGLVLVLLALAMLRRVEGRAALEPSNP